MGTGDAPTTGPGESGPRIPPPVVAAAAAGAQLVLARGRRSTRASRAAAVVLAGAATGLLGGAAAALHRRRTTLSPHTPAATTSLVRSGPFGLSRNPIYLGIAGLLLAHATARRSALAVLPAVAFVIVLDRTQVPAEESALQVRFGAAFDEYVRRVPRWVGVPGPRRREG